MARALLLGRQLAVFAEEVAEVGVGVGGGVELHAFESDASQGEDGPAQVAVAVSALAEDVGVVFVFPRAEAGHRPAGPEPRPLCAEVEELGGGAQAVGVLRVENGVGPAIAACGAAGEAVGQRGPGLHREDVDEEALGVGFREVVAAFHHEGVEVAHLALRHAQRGFGLRCLHLQVGRQFAEGQFGEAGECVGGHADVDVVVPRYEAAVADRAEQGAAVEPVGNAVPLAEAGHFGEDVEFGQLEFAQVLPVVGLHVAGRVGIGGGRARERQPGKVEPFELRQVGRVGELEVLLLASYYIYRCVGKVAQHHAAVVRGAEGRVGEGAAVSLADHAEAEGLGGLHALYAAAVGDVAEHIALQFHHRVDRRHARADRLVRLQGLAHAAHHGGAHQGAGGIVEEEVGVGFLGVGFDGVERGVGTLAAALHEAAQLLPAAALGHRAHLGVVVGVDHDGHLVDVGVVFEGFDAVLEHGASGKLQELFRNVGPHAASCAAGEHDGDVAFHVGGMRMGQGGRLRRWPRA